MPPPFFQAAPNVNKAWLLFAAAIFFWGVNWPIMKVGLEYIAPLWFAALRVTAAAAFLIAVLGVAGRLHLPKREELPVLFSLGVVQTGMFMGLIHLSLLFVEAGRSSVLVYTTPIWVAPLAAVFLGEKLNGRKRLGLAVGVAGLLTLFNPLTFPWGWNGYTAGNAMLIFAAMLWAAVIVHVRGFGWSRPHLSILPWQLALGGAVLVFCAFAVEGPPTAPMTADFAAIMLFNAVPATAFSFWAFISAARVLNANATAMGSLGVPAVGILSSIVILDERLTVTSITGIALIFLGIALFAKATMPSRVYSD